MIEHLGTIAKSGTAAFMENLTGDQQKDSQLIGQFGVGFYSALLWLTGLRFTPARREDAAVRRTLWESHGEAEFSIEARTKRQRGTSITLFLKRDCSEFADDFRVRSVIKKVFRSHLGAGDDAQPCPPRQKAKRMHGSRCHEYEAVNAATALWTRSRSDVSDDEYKEFYKHVSHDFEDP